MAQIIQFLVDDTSPTVSYTPFGDTLSLPNLTAGWNPYYDGSGFLTTVGEIGSGTSYHATSHDNASLSLTWRGTGIQIFGFTDNAGYEIFLDGHSTPSALQGDHLLAGFQNLSDAVHTVTLSSRIPETDTSPLPLLFFEKALIISNVNATADHLFMESSLNNDNISWIGYWSARNVSGTPTHYSNSTGDTAKAQFIGSSFLLSGLTSPQSGAYSVVLDSVETTLFARASFTQQDTLLFYATGLDPETPHQVQIINVDGSELSLSDDGFKVFSAVPPITPATNIVNTQKGPIAKGTIAALVLAGILAFFFLSASLFFLFVVRPRQRRSRNILPYGRKQVVDDPLEDVLNVGADYRARPGTRSDSPGSDKGFDGWKREIEEEFDDRSIGGILFRRSNSRSNHVADRELSNKGRKDKKAGSKQSLHSSWSPSFMLQLPIKTKPSYENNAGAEHPSPAGIPPSMTSGPTSLSYISASPNGASSNPSLSHPKLDSRIGPPSSVPRTVSDDSPLQGHQRGHTGGLGYLARGEQIPGAANYPTSAGENQPTGISLQLPIEHGLHPPSAAFMREDRGSVRSEDTGSYMSANATQIAIRSLRPRTSEQLQPPPRYSAVSSALEGNNSLHAHPFGAEGFSLSGLEEEPRSSWVEISSPVDPHPTSKPFDSSRSSPERPITGSFLDIRVESPFHVEFPGSRRSSTRPPETSASAAGETSSPTTAHPQMPERSVRKLSAFHSTPPGTFSTKRKESFLDLSSSGPSSRTQSTATEASVPDLRRAGTSVRSSSPVSTAVSSRSDRRSAVPPLPSAPSSTSLPIPSFTTHPPSTDPRPEELPTAETEPVQLVSLAAQTGFDIAGDSSSVSQQHPHPTAISTSFPPPSPTDSRPVSYWSEIRFRHRESMDSRSHSSSLNSTRMQRPPSYPALPTTQEQSEPNSPPLVRASSYIVQHTLGKTSTKPGADPGPTGR